MHVWFQDNVNKLIKMGVLLQKSLNDVISITLDVGVAQCTLLIFVNLRQVNYKVCKWDYLSFDSYI